jgi:predicted DNA-binding protein
VERPDIFAIRVSPEERQMIDRLAEREERTPSDTVRRLVRERAREMGILVNAPNADRSSTTVERKY